MQTPFDIALLQAREFRNETDRAAANILRTRRADALKALVRHLQCVFLRKPVRSEMVGKLIETR